MGETHVCESQIEMNWHRECHEFYVYFVVCQFHVFDSNKQASALNHRMGAPQSMWFLPIQSKWSIWILIALSSFNISTPLARINRLFYCFASQAIKFRHFIIYSFVYSANVISKQQKMRSVNREEHSFLTPNFLWFFGLVQFLFTNFRIFASTHTNNWCIYVSMVECAAHDISPSLQSIKLIWVLRCCVPFGSQPSSNDRNRNYRCLLVLCDLF